MDNQPVTEKRLRTLPPQKTQLKALIFDVGDILYDASVWRKWLTGELAKLGKQVTYDQLVAAWESLLVDVYKGKADYWEKFTELMQQFDLNSDEIPAIQASAKEMGQAVLVARAPMPGVPETLAALYARGIKLVALSDTESGEAGVRKTLNQLNIEQYFHAVVSSSVIGHVKPEPQAFDYAILATGYPKRQCGFVAHDIDELAGAQKCDLFAIGYNYHPAAPADRYIEHFNDLLQLVGE